MRGEDMLSFVDLSRTAIERRPGVLEFVRSWVAPILGDSTVLLPEEWFRKGQGIVGGTKDSTGLWIPQHASDGKVYIWSPPPIIADVALEECAKAIHKRTDAYHIFLIPRIYSPLWMRLLYKVSDFVFQLPPASQHWPSSMHEPLFIGISFPGLYDEHRCWWNWSGNCVKCSVPVRRMEGIFCTNFCKPRGSWPACRKVWHAECYECLGQGKFPIKRIQDEEGNRWYKHDRRV